MLRSMMQIYATGSREAVALYRRAFDAELVAEYPDDDGNYYHSELNVYGQIVSVAESRYGAEYPEINGVYPVSFARGAAGTPGNTMQYCLHFGEGNADKVTKGYEVLKEGGLVLYPLGPVDYSPLACDLVDRFGVRWFLFV